MRLSSTVALCDNHVRQSSKCAPVVATLPAGKWIGEPLHDTPWIAEELLTRHSGTVAELPQHLGADHQKLAVAITWARRQLIKKRLVAATTVILQHRNI